MATVTLSKLNATTKVVKTGMETVYIPFGQAGFRTSRVGENDVPIDPENDFIAVLWRNYEISINLTDTITIDGVPFSGTLTALGGALDTVFPKATSLTGGGGGGNADLSNYYTKSQTDSLDSIVISNLKGGAPVAGDTLNKLYNLFQTLNAIVTGSAPDDNSIVDTIQEILSVFSTYPEGTDIAQILAGKVNVTDIVNNLTTSTTGKSLDASQGKILKDLIDQLQQAGSGLQLGETASTAYRGDRGKTAYDFVQQEDKTQLTTTNKARLVDAINEVNAKPSGGSGSSVGGVLLLIDAATIALNASSLYIGFVVSVTIAGNRTIQISNAVDGQNIVLRVIQDATGGRTLTVQNGRATTSIPNITLASAAGAITYISLRYESATNSFAYTGLSY